VASPELKLAIVGKKNVGKSTLLNVFAAEERVIVSDKPGTTRDSIDVRFERDGKVFLAIDTAGVGRRGRHREPVDLFSVARTERTIRRADVVVFMLDCASEISKVDKRIANVIVEAAKPCIVAANKWDRAKEKGIDTAAFERYVADRLRQLDYAPLVFSSARDGENVWAMIDVAVDLAKSACTRVSTANVNRALEEAKAVRRPPRKGGVTPKMYYASQVGAPPPTFVIFVNQRKAFGANYTRFLENFFRERFGFHEIPLRILYKNRRKGKDGKKAL